MMSVHAGADDRVGGGPDPRAEEGPSGDAVARRGAVGVRAPVLDGERAPDTARCDPPRPPAARLAGDGRGAPRERDDARDGLLLRAAPAARAGDRRARP